MTPTEIETRIHNAIHPQIDRCDRLLDHYLQDAPREVWEPIMQQVTGTPAMIADLTIMGLL